MILALLLAAAPLTAEELSATDIAARTIEAMGGAAKFATVESVRVKGKMRFGEGQFTPFTVVAQRPAMFRMELTVGPDHVTQAYDGKAGWQSISGEHSQEPTALTGESLSHLIDQAANAIGGPLLDLEKRHNKVELDGRESVDGVECYKLKVTLATGDPMVLFIDASNFHEVMEELPVQMNGQPATIQQSVSNYRRFGPILVACLFVTRVKGGEESQRLEIESVEINPPFGNSIFVFPAAE